ncbi:hypothetical protein OIU84_012909 [Salix udensis]|uniref:Uncharacterized protein n=1 Tax=Salix udensis TaxID=889485 RepID=A0AAD6JGS7_9ROSI|nr:hypothetical protein OIU84_012909 [Salix udensis]
MNQSILILYYIGFYEMTYRPTHIGILYH